MEDPCPTCLQIYYHPYQTQNLKPRIWIQKFRSWYRENENPEIEFELKLEFEPEFVNLMGEIKGEKCNVKPRGGIQIHGISSPRIWKFNSRIFG
jgi:hypothetical protein